MLGTKVGLSCEAQSDACLIYLPDHMRGRLKWKSTRLGDNILYLMVNEDRDDLTFYIETIFFYIK